ncbi:DUF4339 domain-containing protein, partial [Lysobacter sp. 1R34A]|uniref:DUF4339 domain-containing protein n=1 Tax=Lysobacter sp. 1R34A TaxID=3445786 RepID=UPI003EEF0A3C
MSQWYYSDNDRNRHGPLEGADMAALHHGGELGPDTLVWRDGLAQWRPWRELAHELVAEPGFAAEERPQEVEAGAAAIAAEHPAVRSETQPEPEPEPEPEAAA